VADPLQTPVAPELPAESNASAEALPAVLSKAWGTLAAIGASVVIFVGLAIENNYQSWDTLARWGYLPAEGVWRGGYWGLLTSAFVHLAIWHLAFNVYWLVVLGARMERAIGSLTYLAFFLAAAIVSSAWQIGVSGVSGHGASGVGYAIFGFMWISRDRFPGFRQVLDKQTINLFLAWLIACIVATYLKVWIVGNAAHVTGMVFGVLVAATFGSGYWRRIAQATLAALVVGAVVPLYWAPWSVQWLTVKAYDAHVALRYDDAVNYYSRIIKLDPDNALAYINRSLAYRGLGDVDRAEADREKALAINPNVEQVER
jgi:GlpG protein